MSDNRKSLIDESPKTMTPSLSAIFLALKWQPATNPATATYDERRSNSGRCPPDKRKPSITTSRAPRKRDLDEFDFPATKRGLIISSRPPDHRNSPLLFLV